MQKNLMKKTGKKVDQKKAKGKNLQRDGEHEPEEDPEEWIDGVADEAEEKRSEKMQGLEKPEGSTEGISFLTTRSVYDWRKKPYHHGDGNTSKRWKRRSRRVAREIAFAEGKGGDIFSPATSGHVLNFYPLKYWVV